MSELDHCNCLESMTSVLQSAGMEIRAGTPKREKSMSVFKRDTLGRSNPTDWAAFPSHRKLRPEAQNLIPAIADSRRGRAEVDEN